MSESRRWACRSAAAGILALALASGALAEWGEASLPASPGSYSSFEFNDEGGDLLGFRPSSARAREPLFSAGDVCGNLRRRRGCWDHPQDTTAQRDTDESRSTALTQSCRIDLDRDGRDDLAVFRGGTPDDGELIALLARQSGYEAHVLFHGDSSLVLACRRGDVVAETKAGRGSGAKHDTGGAFLTLSQPEGASFAFYWTGSKFQQVTLFD